jgi:hypothetical protein
MLNVAASQQVNLSVAIKASGSDIANGVQVLDPSTELDHPARCGARVVIVDDNGDYTALGLARLLAEMGRGLQVRRVGIAWRSRRWMTLWWRGSGRGGQRNRPCDSMNICAPTMRKGLLSSALDYLVRRPNYCLMAHCQCQMAKKVHP